VFNQLIAYHNNESITRSLRSLTIIACPGLRLDTIQFPDTAFSISSWATGLAGVRSLTTGKNGYIVAGSSGSQVYVVIPPKVSCWCRIAIKRVSVICSYS
jgi:hypothetical protein